MFKQFKNFVKEHPWEILTGVLLVEAYTLLYLYNKEKNVADFYHGQMCDITEAARRDYVMSYNWETDRVHLSKPKKD